MSRPTRGAWIETLHRPQVQGCHSWSRPTRGAWIETNAPFEGASRNRRAPRGARGLKRVLPPPPKPMAGRRAPRGARGLKLVYFVGCSFQGKSRPTRGAWIETSGSDSKATSITSRPTRGAWIETIDPQHCQPHDMSRPTRGAWIETGSALSLVKIFWSRPTRGAWIETIRPRPCGLCRYVAPHAGRVD